MAVSEDEVRKIAELARLAPGADAIRRLTDELNGILDHVRVLEGLEASGGTELSGEATEPAVRDAETPPDPLSDGAPAGLAPDWRDGFFLVPRLPALDDDLREERA